MNPKSLEIQKAILEIENPYPKDDLIACYKDFLKVRDFLPYYKFNLNVFTSLLDLTIDLWFTDKRINRISLLKSLHRYGFNVVSGKGFMNSVDRSTKMPSDVYKRAFLLLKNCYEHKCSLSQSQLEEAKQICNRILFNASLEDIDISWLCKNVEKSNMILNRILRYPQKSVIISNWARINYTNDEYRIRRSELASWLLDENPSFEIDMQTLLDDFEYFNLLDKKAIQEYEDEIEAQNIIERDLNGILSTQQHPKIYFGVEISTQESITSTPKLELIKRSYNIMAPDFSKHYDAYIPDFVKMRKEFHSNIEKTQKITMLWAIAYSRLENNVKPELLKKYYSDEIYWSFFKICKKLKLIHLLEWLIDRP
jgi:hypothetical protein